MNTKKFLLGMFAAVVLAGCSSDDVANDGGEISNGDVRYLKVNIVSTPAVEGSRATTGDPNGAQYENGTTAENAVEKVRFYFFTDDGSATGIKADGTNYYDWSPATPLTTGTSVNVEKALEATIVISTKAGDKIPSKLLAVLNPDEADLPSTNLSLSDLRNKFKDYAATTNKTNGFVMVSSVYVDAAGERVSTAAVKAENLQTTEALAKANPVVMYVERNVAKVSLTIDEEKVTKNAKGYYELKDSEGNALTYTENGVTKNIYLDLTGWNLTATTSQAYLSKHVNTSWKSDLFENNIPWNYYPYFRSYWGTNVFSGTTTGTDESGYNYCTYNEIGTTNKADGTSTVYTNENAATNYNTGAQRANPTQVIVAGKLVDADGNAIELCEFMGAKYVGTSNLITAMLPHIQLYKKTTTTDAQNVTTTTYTQITADDLELVPAQTKDNTLDTQDKDGRYYVEFQLKDANSKWCLSNVQGTNEATTAEVEAVLKTIHAKVWKTGLTYYWFKVRHLSNKDVGMYGIVRNHSYQITVNSIVGFGTPVFDPTQTIYPETPVDQDTYIAAQINILSWRVVPSTVDLGK